MNQAPIYPRTIADDLGEAGFAFVQSVDMRATLLRAGSLADWPAFAHSWNDLAIDTYMADQGRYRRRRHAVFAIDGSGRIVRQPARAHYQSLDYNPLHGGVARWFAPIVDEIADGPSLHTILRYCHELFVGLAPAAVASWQVEVHQFRIEARADEAGKPTPEGVHRDGVDYVLVLLIARNNIVSGTTTIHAPDRSLLGSFTLTDAFDAALVVDARVFHGVTPVQPLDPRADAFRDVLVVTFRAQG
jgi:hypothetical protein